jgi:hypothetical protein
MQDFIDRHGLTFPNASDDAGAVFSRFRVPSQPAWVFIDAAGGTSTHLGALDPDELSAIFDELTA